MDVQGTTCLGSGPQALSDDALVGMIQDTIEKNYVSIGMLLLTLAVAGVIVSYVGTAVYQLFTKWRRLTQGAITKQASADSLDDARSDRERANTEAPMLSEVAAARLQLQDLEKRYKPYNEAMKRYASRRGELPDDLIDNRIVSRDYDDYDYKVTQRKGHKRQGMDRRVITDPNRPLVERSRNHNHKASHTDSDSDDDSDVEIYEFK